jgi:hypothetical protein
MIRALGGAIAGVLLVQMLTLPAAALLFGVLWCLQHLLGRLDGTAQIAWNLTVIFSMVGLFVLGAVSGLLVGWGVAARIASGTPVADSLAASRVLRALLSRLPFIRWCDPRRYAG